VTKDSINVPTARTWRDIPQPVKPRAMSPGGRWRLIAAALRMGVAAALMAGMAAGVWFVAATLQEEPGTAAAAATAVPMRTPHLITNRDGVLDSAWLARTLALPPRATLMELDLDKLRAALLAQGQVLTATLTRHFPDQLIVHITERSPIARVMAAWDGYQYPLVVARDGVIFAGEGHHPVMLEALPWLDGVTIVRRGEGFLPIDGMPAVAELLAKARLETEHLYQSWHSVSLARLDDDLELEVRSEDGLTIVFGARGDFVRQLARLDYLVANVPALPHSGARIDLSHGRDVRVLPPSEASAARARAAPARAFPLYPSKTQAKSEF
jgi:hypothetical protein